MGTFGDLASGGLAGWFISAAILTSAAYGQSIPDSQVFKRRAALAGIHAVSLYIDSPKAGGGESQDEGARRRIRQMLEAKLKNAGFEILPYSDGTSTQMTLNVSVIWLYDKDTGGNTLGTSTMLQESADVLVPAPAGAARKWYRLEAWESSRVFFSDPMQLVRYTDDNIRSLTDGFVEAWTQAQR